MRLSLARKSLSRRLLTDRCRVSTNKYASQGVVNEATFVVSFPAPSVIYEGRCKLSTTAGSREVPASEQREDRLLLTVPYEVTGIRAGHTVVMLDSNDGDVAHQAETFEVLRVHVGTNRLSRTCELARRSDLPTTGGA